MALWEVMKPREGYFVLILFHKFSSKDSLIGYRLMAEMLASGKCILAPTAMWILCNPRMSHRYMALCELMKLNEVNFVLTLFQRFASLDILISCRLMAELLASGILE